MGVLLDLFAPYSVLGRLSYGAAQDQRCLADLFSMLENLVVSEAGLSAWRLQTGWGFPDIQPPLDLSFCRQPLAIPTPVDLSVLICRQNVACINLASISHHVFQSRIDLTSVFSISHTFLSILHQFDQSRIVLQF